MEGRMRMYGCSSPERMRGRGDPPPATRPQPTVTHLQQRRHHRSNHQNQNYGNQQQQQLRQGMKIAVVYYLCRNRHFDHPHFIEVLISSPRGLFLKDVVDRLNVLRGKGMAALYSWSCKRSYKNGFVWHDLSEDDLIVPTLGNEYVLKGSELLDDSPPPPPLPGRTPKLLQNANDHHHHPPPPLSAPPRSPFRLPPPPPQQPREDDLPSPPDLGHSCSSSWNASPESNKPNSSSQGSDGSPSLSPSTSPSPTKYKLHHGVSSDASTQTDEKPRPRESRIIKNQTNEEISPTPPPTSTKSSSGGDSGKGETLESLIRANALKMNSFKILEDDEVLLSNPVSASKLKATNALMQLITCGSISVKDHLEFGIVPTYKPRFSHVNYPSPMFSSSAALGELDCLSNDSRFIGLKLDDKGYFSGSLVETKKKHEEEGCGIPKLNRSSSYNSDRNEAMDSGRLKCLPRTIKMTTATTSSCKQSKKKKKKKTNEITRSPLVREEPRVSSENRLGYKSTGSSKRLESFREDKPNVIEIEERLTSGARVIIKSRASTALNACDDSE